MIIYANLEETFYPKVICDTSPWRVCFQVNDLMQDYHLYTTSVTKVRARKNRGQELSCSTAFVSVALEYLCVSAKQPSELEFDGCAGSCSSNSTILQA